MREQNHHAALWLCVDNSSSIPRTTRRSSASINKGTCQRPGIFPRQTHISTAFLEILNLSESATGPPSRSTIEAVSLMGTETVTACSAGQAKVFTLRPNTQFLAHDIRDQRGNSDAMPRIISQEQQGLTAFRRLRELLTDMRWDDEWAVAQFSLEIAEPLGLSTPKKTVEMWFDRESIPSHQIFNVAECLGIAPGWMTGQARLSKEQAVYPGGLYHREVVRLGRLLSA
jgi:hypothetical protein